MLIMAGRELDRGPNFSGYFNNGEHESFRKYWEKTVAKKRVKIRR